jgi:hypothetical protein
VLLANPRWERRFVKFLELSGVGRVMADGTDEDGARMDEWVAWETVGEAALGARVNLASFSFRHSFVRGARTPRLAHSALPRADDFFSVVVSRPRAGGWAFPLYFLGRISLGDGWRCRVNKIK